MAGLALFTALTLMNVLQPVAGDAAGLQILIDLSSMADFAANFLVGADERILSLVVIKGLGVAPGILLVADAAFPSEPAFVWLVIFVTSNTSGWRVAEFGIGRMTSRAGNDLVRAVQRKVREMMVKSFWVKPHDIGVTTDVVGVTMLAFRLGNILAQAVKATSVAKVVIHLVVAIEAETRLRLL